MLVASASDPGTKSGRPIPPPECCCSNADAPMPHQALPFLYPATPIDSALHATLALRRFPPFSPSVAWPARREQRQYPCLGMSAPASAGADLAHVPPTADSWLPSAPLAGGIAPADLRAALARKFPLVSFALAIFFTSSARGH